MKIRPKIKFILDLVRAEFWLRIHLIFLAFSNTIAHSISLFLLLFGFLFPNVYLLLHRWSDVDPFGFENFWSSKIFHFYFWK